MAITILNQAVLNITPAALTTYTLTGFNVPSGTDTLILVITMRGGSATTATEITSVTHNAIAMTMGVDNCTVGDQEINTWAGYQRAPSVGTFDVVINCVSVRGGAAYLLALAGVKSTGTPFGATPDLQREASPATATVGLGLTPTLGSLLLADLAITLNTTLSSWTGTGFVEHATGTYSGSNFLTLTARYRLNAPASVNTVEATFAAADAQIGGSLIEVLAEATATVDVSGDIAFGLAITGTAGIEGVSSARIADFNYRAGKSTWTEILLLQPDVAGVDRRIISAGPSIAPNYTLDMVATGTAATNVYRWRYRLADGLVTVETGPGSQTTAAHVIALLHRPGDPVAYVNGIESVSSRSGQLRIGVLDPGAGGMALGGHDLASPAPYSGVIGRYLVYDGEMSLSQLRLLTTSLLDPDAIWGYGSENDAQVANRSPVAMPMLVEPDGRPTMTITPRTIDPDGSQPTITAVNQGLHTAVAISGSTQLFLTFERGWQGIDAFHYSIGDSFKFSTGKIIIDQRRPALLARNDAITVQADGSILFDPRLNDTGAGALRVISVTQPSAGTAAVQADGRILYTPGA